MLQKHIITARFLDAEHRFIFVFDGVLDGAGGFAGEDPEAVKKREEEKKIADKESALKKEMEIYFAERTDIGEIDLRQYLLEKKVANNELNTFEKKLEDAFAIVDGSNDNQKLQDAALLLRQTYESMNVKNKSIQERSKMRRNFNPDTSGAFSPLGTTLEFGKNTLQGAWNTFNSPKATGPEKAAMLTTVAVALVGSYYLWSKTPSKVKNGLLLSVAGVVALEGIWKFYSYASPDKKNLAQQCDLVAEELKKNGISADFLKEIGKDNKGIIPVAGILDMEAGEFMDVYAMAKAERSMDPLPGRNLPKDGLSPSERFAIIDDIAKTVGLADADGELKQVPDILKGKTMLTLIVDYKNNPLIPKNDKK